MTRKDCGSNTSGIHMMVDYWTELVGSWPNIKMRWHYSMFIKEDYWQNSLQWNGAVFMFHTNKHTFNINLSGATQTGVLAAGVLDLPFGNGPSVYHTPGCSTSFGNFSASGVLGESQSVGVQACTSAAIQGTSIHSMRQSITNYQTCETTGECICGVRLLERHGTSVQTMVMDQSK